MVGGVQLGVPSTAARPLYKKSRPRLEPASSLPVLQAGGAPLPQRLRRTADSTPARLCAPQTAGDGWGGGGVGNAREYAALTAKGRPPPRHRPAARGACHLTKDGGGGGRACAAVSHNACWGVTAAGRAALRSAATPPPARGQGEHHPGAAASPSRLAVATACRSASGVWCERLRHPGVAPPGGPEGRGGPPRPPTSPGPPPHPNHAGRGDGGPDTEGEGGHAASGAGMACARRYGPARV